MRKTSGSFPCVNQIETIWGWGYLLFQLILLPSLLQAINGVLTTPLTATELNFTFFLLNFLAIIWIFHDFLGSSASQAIHHPAYFCQAVILGLAAYCSCRWGVNWCVRQIQPGFVNANDASIAALAKGNYFLMIIGTVILAPPVEECFYRGLVFRTLYKTSHWAAYLVSIAVFALVHIVGYIGKTSPLGLLLCFLQYLPAGLCLAWCYVKSGTIYAPIAAHAVINALTIQTLR